MDLQLNGKIACVTGAADPRGLGFAIARRFLREGCRCLLIDIDGELVRRAAAELGRFGQVRAWQGDVAEPARMAAIIAEAVAEFGRIDIYVNNAGVCPNVPLEEMAVEDWDRGMAVNLRSVFLSAGLVAPHMPPGGSIINAASFVSLIPTAGLGLYSASKAGVLSLTRVMAAELSGRGIRVNAYVPGLMDTGMNRERIETAADRLRTQIASAAFGVPDDVANAVAFLASDAARYINGTHLEIAGGKFCVQNPDYAHGRREGGPG